MKDVGLLFAILSDTMHFVGLLVQFAPSPGAIRSYYFRHLCNEAFQKRRKGSTKIAYMQILGDFFVKFLHISKKSSTFALAKVLLHEKIYCFIGCDMDGRGAASPSGAAFQRDV